MDLRAAARHAVPLAGTALALIAGLVLLGRKSLWTDEAVAVRSAHRPIDELVRHIADHDPGAAGYLLLLHPIVHLEDAEWAVRLPSVVGATLAALCMFQLGSRLFGRLAGVGASIALATGGGVVAVSQQARPFALAVLAVTLSTLMLVLAVDRGRAWWALYAASLVLLPLVHPLALSVLAAHGAALAFHPLRRTLIRPAGLAIVCALALVAVPLAAAAHDRLGDVHAGSRLDPGELALGLGRAAGWNPLLVALAAWGVVAVAIGRAPSAARWKAVLVGGLIIAPAVALVGAGVAMPVFADWSLVMGAPGLALGAGVGLAALAEERSRQVIGLAALAAALVGVAAWLAGPSIEDWRSAAAVMRSDPGATETVIVLPPRSADAFAHYRPDTRLAGVARGAGAWIFIAEDTGTRSTISAARRVVTTPRYALLSEKRFGSRLVLQHWVRP
jgi:mannosyltransferase